MGGSKEINEASEVASCLGLIDRGSDLTFLYVIE